MIIWGIGEHDNLDSISMHSSRDTAVAGILDLMNDKGAGWTWEVTTDTDDLIEMTGTGPLSETSLLIAVRRELLA